MTQSLMPTQLILVNPYTGKGVEMMPVFTFLHSLDDVNDKTEGFTIVATKILEILENFNYAATGNLDDSIAESNIYLCQLAKVFMSLKHVNE